MADKTAPPDPHTHHRFHWVKKNDHECWEWFFNSGAWYGPRGYKSAQAAAREGWEYVGEAHPPKLGELRFNRHEIGLLASAVFNRTVALRNEQTMGENNHLIATYGDLLARLNKALA